MRSQRPSQTQAMPAAAEGLDIRVAALGEDRLPIGAAELAFERLLADPLLEGVSRRRNRRKSRSDSNSSPMPT